MLMSTNYEKWICFNEISRLAQWRKCVCLIEEGEAQPRLSPHSMAQCGVMFISGGNSSSPHTCIKLSQRGTSRTSRRARKAREDGVHLHHTFALGSIYTAQMYGRINSHGDQFFLPSVTPCFNGFRARPQHWSRLGLVRDRYRKLVTIHSFRKAKNEISLSSWAEWDPNLRQSLSTSTKISGTEAIRMG